MKQLTFKECCELVRKTCEKIEAYSITVETLIVMIIAHESLRGKYRRQLKAFDPALGLGQIERMTFSTIMKYSARINTYLIRAGYEPTRVKFEDLETNDELCIIFIRARLSMDINPLPVSFKDQANYCKEYWNTESGEATPEEYYNDYMIWREQHV